MRPDPDAKLLALREEFLEVAALLAHIDERLAGHDADEEEVDRLRAATDPLLLSHDALLVPIAALTATTNEGRRMKARAAFAAMRTIEEMEWADALALVRSALRDVAGLTEPAAEGVPA
jgi:hypothetical protein